ncbi:hypothetical protein BGW80DRAFT_1559793, partial [Lactifluus volemus]
MEDTTLASTTVPPGGGGNSNNADVEPCAGPCPRSHEPTSSSSGSGGSSSKMFIWRRSRTFVADADGALLGKLFRIVGAGSSQRDAGKQTEKYRPCLLFTPSGAPSPVSIAGFSLRNIPHGGYPSSEVMVRGVSTLTRFTYLDIVICFESPASRTDRPGKPTLKFHGISEYLDDLMAQIDAPLVEDVDITCSTGSMTYLLSVASYDLRNVDLRDSLDRNIPPSDIHLIYSPLSHRASARLIYNDTTSERTEFYATEPSPSSDAKKNYNTSDSCSSSPDKLSDSDRVMEGTATVTPPGGGGGPAASLP